MFRKQKFKGSSFALGTLVGGIVGGVTALLFAPKSGSKMRKDIIDQYHKVSENANELLEEVNEHTYGLAQKAKNLAEGAKDAASKYFHE